MKPVITSAILSLAIVTWSGAAAAQEPNFGRAVVATDTEVLIGQPVNWYGPGTVYSYGRDAGGVWRERTRLTAVDTSRMDDFGRALAVSGNRLLVGAPRKHDGAGSVHVFARSDAAGAWRLSEVLSAPDGGQFGSALALTGDAALIAAPRLDGGVVYDYRQQGTTWRAVTSLHAPGAEGFGSAIAVDGDWMLVGAPASDSAAGRAYFVRRGADDAWGAPSRVRLPAVVAPGGARVGSAVLLQGERAYIGAPGASVVYVLERDAGNNWNPLGELRPFDVSRNSGFGSAIAVVDGELWVGAPSTQRGNGRVYRFVPDGDGAWSMAARFDADSADGTAWPFGFGYAIAAAGDEAVVSMPSRDFGEGRVMVAARSGDEWQASQILTGEIHVIGGGAADPARCTDGALGSFTCNNVELVSHVPVAGLGGDRGAWVNDVWGWTDPEQQRDYALVARRDGTSFVDLTDPSAPRLVGTMSRTAGSPPSVWRDIKVLGHHAYIVADGAGDHGMQVFDLHRLRDAGQSPVAFTPDTTYHGIASAHNVVADTATGYLYVVGSNSGGETCGGGLHIVDARNPEQLRFAGCYHSPGVNNSRGYTHDAQCLVYAGPDSRYRGREICVAANETEINISDVSDKSNPVLIGRNSYPDVAYAHQGWFDEAQRYFYMNDEGDELAGLVEGTRTIIWDLSELDDPVVAGMYIGPVRSSDHNLYVVGDRVYESNYGSGLRVLDISDRTRPREIGFFDSAPFNDNGPGHSAAQSGAWSNYPFFKSGVVVFTSVREGLFVIRVADVPTS